MIKRKWTKGVEVKNYSMEENKLEKCRIDVVRAILEMRGITMTRFNEIVRDTADRNLKVTYGRKVSGEKEERRVKKSERI